MKQPEDSATLELDLNPRRGPGRPPKGDRPMTAAERQRAYRRREKRLAIEFTDAGTAKRVTLMAELAYQLAKLEEPDTPYGGGNISKHEAARHMAAVAIQEIVTRYGLTAP